MDVKHGYDYAGNRLWREDVVADANSQDHDEFYTYDGLHRLTDAQRGNLTGTYPDYTGVTSKNFEQEFTLDQLGNWPTFKHDSDGNGFDFTQSRTHNAVNELTEFTTTSWIDPVHDAAGNMTTMPQPLDPTDDFTAVYDAWNRMVEVKDGGATVLTNEYDGLNQRIVKDVNGGDTFDYYYNDKWQLLTEAHDGTAEAIYAWHPYYIDALAVRFRVDDRHAFLHDDNFNVVAAYDIKSGSGTYRQVVERYQYSPYGEVTFLNADFSVKMTQASAIGNNILYTGRERDPETGLQLNRNRFYHPLLGRWLTRDPIGYRSGTNLYGYVGSMPTRYVDPTGKIAVVALPIGWGAWEIGIGIGAGIGAAGAWWFRDDIDDACNACSENVQDLLEELYRELDRLQRKLESILRDSREQRRRGGIGEGYDTSKTESDIQTVLDEIARLEAECESGGGSGGQDRPRDPERDAWGWFGP